MTAEFDLIVLVPGKDDEAALKTLIGQRHDSLGVRRISAQFLVCPGRDPGCIKDAVGLLAPFLNRAPYALVVFDYEGCGQEHRKPADELERELADRLAAAGWDDRAAVIVVRPELEAWVWSDSPEVDAVLGWQDRTPALREWLMTQGFLEGSATKPRRPKEAMEAALKVTRRPRSSAHFGKLAASVGISRCSDPAFARLCAILKGWFGTTPHQ